MPRDNGSSKLNRWCGNPAWPPLAVHTIISGQRAGGYIPDAVSDSYARSRPMLTRFNKVHPALKHAGYSATTLLPGEDSAAFDKLHTKPSLPNLPLSERSRRISSPK